jgi:hypothetical protein
MSEEKKVTEKEQKQLDALAKVLPENKSANDLIASSVQVKAKNDIGCIPFLLPIGPVWIDGEFCPETPKVVITISVFKIVSQTITIDLSSGGKQCVNPDVGVAGVEICFWGKDGCLYTSGKVQTAFGMVTIASWDDTQILCV